MGRNFELVTSLSTESLERAFQRFISRCGRPKCVYSENQTNFKGCYSSLNLLDCSELKNFFTIERIKWEFNLPTAVWWGSWWKILIKMIIRLLVKVLGKACISYDELATIRCSCESTINSRPLT